MPRYNVGKLEAAIVRKHPNFNRILDIMEAIAKDQALPIMNSKWFDNCDNDYYYKRTHDYITFAAYEQMYFPHDDAMICKTNGEPCDTAVVACYHVASTLMKELYRFGSDGDESCDDPTDPYQNARGTSLDEGLKLVMP